MNIPAVHTLIRCFACCALLSWGWYGGSALAAGPAFDCSKAETGSIEAMICADQELAALDRKLADVYGQAVKKAVNEHPPVLKAEQWGGQGPQRVAVGASRRGADHLGLWRS